MKTIKNSISMRTFFVAIFAVSFTAAVNGQFQPGSETSQTLEEVRTGSTVTYSVPADGGAPHVDGDSYRWAVIGGTITGSIETAAITTSGDSSILEFTENNYQITVDWDTDIDPATDPLGSEDGQILVQKLSATGSCPSDLQNLPVRRWNPATATLADGTLAICSGDALPASLSVALTGAPDGSANGFTVTYSIAVSSGDITDGNGDPVDGTGLTVSTDTDNVNIDLPASLINTGTTAETFTLTLTDMHDDFQGSGTYSGTYVVTVYPVPETGDIESSASLSRR